MYGYGNSMFLATHGILARTASGGGIDPDAQAFITAASITDPTQQSAINQLVVDLKGYGIWTKMKGIWPFVGGTSSTHKWNLKDPRDLDAAFRLVFSGGWTHSVNGALPNGTNAYASSKCNISTQISTTSHSFGIYSRTNSTSGTQVYGLTGFLQNNLSNGNFISGAIGGIINYTANPTTSLLMATRRSATDFQAYRAGVSLGTNTTNQTGNIPSGEFWFAARNNFSSGEFFCTQQLSFAFLSDGLTDTEAANFYTAVQAFQVTLGRSIGTQTVSDADAQAFVTNAGIVDQVEANAINNLVIGLKADSLWTKMKAIYPFVGGTSTTNSYNLKNTAQYQISWVGGVTHASTGITTNGTNGYGNTGLIPSSVLTLNNTHLSIYSRTTGTPFGGDIGYQTSGDTANLFISGNLFGLFYADSYAITSRITTSPQTSGFYINTRTASNSFKVFRNTLQLGSTITSSSGNLPASSINIGVLLSSGWYANKNYAFASIGDGLTDTEATNFYNRVQTFNTALNRNV